MAEFTSVSEQIELARLFQEKLSTKIPPPVKIASKHKLAKGHYTREFLISDHQQLIRDLKGRYPMSTIPDRVSASKLTIPSNQNLTKYKKYKKIKIHDLSIGVVNMERILYAKTIVKGASMVSLHTVIEDEFGGVCKLCIYNLNEGKSALFELGVDLAIINPYYKKAGDGMNLMRVDNPAEIFIITESDPKSPILPLSPLEHKELGNNLFKEGRLNDAIHEYTQAIEGGRGDPGYLSNRSLCYIKLEQFELALSDANAAAAINPNEPKFRYRQAMSWSGLGNHIYAIRILRELISEASDIIEFRDKVTQENIYLKHQRGVFDLPLIENLAMSRSPIQIADFIGPIELGVSSVKGCAERGLFATRDIKKGELLHLSKAAVFLGDFVMDFTNVLEVNIDAMNANAPPFRVLASKLIDKMNESPLFASRVINVIEDDISRSSPFYTNIELYTDKGFEVIQNLDPPKFSLEHIRHITTRKAHSSSVHGSTNSATFSQMQADIVSGKNTYGFWFIQSLLNHSCLGNVLQITKGEISVLKAFRNVKKGEELFLSRFDAAFFMTLADRETSLQTVYAYDCHCQLCEYESQKEIRPILKRVRKLGKQVRKFADQYSYSPNSLLRSLIPLDRFRNYVARALELAEQLELGPYTFCGTLWAAFIDLTCVWVLEENEMLSFYKQIEKYICELEAYHENTYWNNYLNYCKWTLGDIHPLTLQVSEKFAEFDKLFEWK